MKSLQPRAVDELGRVVIPIEVRRTHGIRAHSDIEFYVEGDSINLQKAQMRCVICSSVHVYDLFRGKPLCSNCKESLVDEFCS